MWVRAKIVSPTGRGETLGVFSSFTSHLFCQVERGVRGAVKYSGVSFFVVIKEEQHATNDQ
jgi:hypothetical protein